MSNKFFYKYGNGVIIPAPKHYDAALHDMEKNLKIAYPILKANKENDQPIEIKVEIIESGMPQASITLLDNGEVEIKENL